MYNNTNKTYWSTELHKFVQIFILLYHFIALQTLLQRLAKMNNEIILGNHKGFSKFWFKGQRLQTPIYNIWHQFWNNRRPGWFHSPCIHIYMCERR